MVKAVKKGDTVEAPEQLQFPSVAGVPEVEVSERSADGSEGLNYQKDYVVLVNPAGRKPTDDEDARSRQGVLREALNRGLHADTEATFDGADKHADGVSTVWHYSVKVTPAAVDSEPETTVTPAHSEHQPAND